MDNSSLPNRKYMLKKSSYAAALNTAVILAIMILTVMAIVSYLEANSFILALHLPLLAVITCMAVVAYYIKMPPPYVELVDGSVRVRRKMLGGWETAAIKNLQVAEVRGNNLYMVFGEGEGREMQINLDAMNYSDARELHDLINNLS